MKKTTAFMFVLLLVSTIIVGCGDKTIIPEKGDFSFSLPEGYSIANITDTQCDIIQDDSGRTIGGFAITDFKIKDLRDEDTKNIMQYLRTSFHKTNRVEFCAMNFGNTHPTVSVNITAYYEDKSASEFWHYFFEKDMGVYHMWFDMSVAEEGIRSDFVPIIHANG